MERLRGRNDYSSCWGCERIVVHNPIGISFLSEREAPNIIVSSRRYIKQSLGYVGMTSANNIIMIK
jgi:hypothetical protein